MDNSENEDIHRKKIQHKEQYMYKIILKENYKRGNHSNNKKEMKYIINKQIKLN